MHADKTFSLRLMRVVSVAAVLGAVVLLSCTPAPAAAEPSPDYKAAAAEYKRLCALDAACAEKTEAKREKAAQRRLARKLAEIQALRDAQEGPKTAR